jgi:hypothetical protein
MADRPASQKSSSLLTDPGMVCCRDSARRSLVRSSLCRVAPVRLVVYRYSGPVRQVPDPRHPRARLIVNNCSAETWFNTYRVVPRVGWLLACDVAPPRIDIRYPPFRSSCTVVHLYISCISVLFPLHVQDQAYNFRVLCGQRTSPVPDTVKPLHTCK